MQNWLKQYSKLLLATLILLAIAGIAEAQCSICTKTAAQLGEKPAKGLNAGILYLAFTPLAIISFVGYKWWQKEKKAKY